MLGSICTGFAMVHLGNLSGGLTHLERAAKLSEMAEADSDAAQRLEASVSRSLARANGRAYLAYALCWSGYSDRARRLLPAASDPARSVRENVMALIQRLRLPHFLVAPTQLAEPAEEVLRISQKFGFSYFIATAKIFQGYAMAHSHDPRTGRTLIQEGLSVLMADDFVLWCAYFHALLAETHQLEGDVDTAFSILTRALSMARRLREGWCEGELKRRIGIAHWLKGNPDKATICFREAISVAAAQSAKLFELRASVSFARLLARQGKRDEAYNVLNPVYAWFSEGFDTPDLLDARALLTELAHTSGAT